MDSSILRGSARRQLGRRRSPDLVPEILNRGMSAPSDWRLRGLHPKVASTTPLTFVSINRLAELLLRANPHILRALRATYPFVFVDEFQDTTYVQYDFLVSAFADGLILVWLSGTTAPSSLQTPSWHGSRSTAVEWHYFAPGNRSTARGRF